MPSPIVHLDILFRLYERVSLEVTTDLVFGVISPDAIHMRANQTWSDKALTHFYKEADEDYHHALWTANHYFNEFSSDFKRGYLIHLLTDYKWRDDVYTPFFEVQKVKMLRSELHALYYRDMSKLDQVIVNEANWIEEAKMLLSKDINLASTSYLTKEEIIKWRHQVIEQDLLLHNKKEVGELEYFKTEVIRQYIDQIIQDLTIFIWDNFNV